MGTLGIDVAASASDNRKTFKRMNVDTGVFTYDEIAEWMRTLSQISECQGLADLSQITVHLSALSCAVSLAVNLFSSLPS